MRILAAAVLAALVLTGCSVPDQPDSEPTFGGGADPEGVSRSQLANLKAAAGIEGCPVADASPPAADALPAIELNCLGGGRTVRLSGLGGRPTIVNLWASWCGPCRKELPLLARAHRELGDRVQLIGVDMADGAPEAALQLARLSSVTYPQLVDRTSRIRGPLRVVGLPQTVFVDAQGRMVFTERAPFRSYADLTAAIREHLGVKP